MRYLFFSLFIFCVLKVNAQNYLISFAGTGAATTVSTVKVENLTSGMALTLNGDDILRLSLTTDITPIGYSQSSEIKIYPNPMSDKSILQFYPTEAGDAIISVNDMTGRLLAQTKSYLETGLQEFTLSGLNSGFYLIRVKGNSFQYSGKILCNSKAYGTTSITHNINNKAVTAVESKISKTDAKGAQSTIDMTYTPGDRFKFTGISGIYSTVKTDIPTQDKTITFNFIPCTDGDNNNYPIVEIGTQTWMAENLKTTKYNDRAEIPLVTDNTAWVNSTIPAFCWWGNDEASSKATYGALYNWYSVNTGKLCPMGSHAPTRNEWEILNAFLGVSVVGGGKLKETGFTHWHYPNTSATNETGFTALPGAFRSDAAAFGPIGYNGYWWSSTQYNTDDGFYIYLTKNVGTLSYYWYRKHDGYSVRCLIETTPAIVTSVVTVFTRVTATVGGNVTGDGGTIVTERGVFWGTSQNPVSTGTKLKIGSGTGSFSTNLSGLNPNITYYIRAYATNGAGTSYGNEVNFTSSPITVPTLTITAVSSITQTTSISGGNVTDDGGENVTARGVCWSTSSNPTIADNNTLNGTGTGTFISNLTGLTPHTTYYVRSYATNNIGTSYSEQGSFITYKVDAITDIDGNYYNIVIIGTQTWMAENLKVTSYSNGDLIGTTTPASLDIGGESSPKYQWAWEGVENSVATYGRLYTWYVANDSRNVCPIGWHVPSDAEWTTLTDFLGGESIAGGKLKESGFTHWMSPNTDATNETGFTALPGGYRSNRVFTRILYDCYLWSSTEYNSDPGDAWERSMGFSHGHVGRYATGYEKEGYSIRCLKD